MKKSELIEKLNKIDGDPEVVLSRDAEGNGFSTTIDVDHSDVNYDGEPCHPDDADPNGPRVIVLWP